MTQPFFSRICTLLAVCMIPLAASAENYDTWKDSTYAFSSVHKLYVDTLDTSQIQADTPMKVYRLKEDFQKKAGAIKGISVVMPALEAPAPPALRQKAAKKETTKKAMPIPQSVEIKHAACRNRKIRYYSSNSNGRVGTIAVPCACRNSTGSY